MTLLTPARKRLKTRIDCFTRGNLVTAKVRFHGRVFVPYKSFRDYSVEVEYTPPEGKLVKGMIQKTSGSFQKQYPIGSEIQALYEPKTKVLFLPAEIDAEIVEY